MTQPQQIPSAALPHPPNHPPQFKQRAIKKILLISLYMILIDHLPQGSHLVHTVVHHQPEPLTTKVRPGQLSVFASRSVWILFTGFKVVPVEQ